jgi:hypothetical protein
MASAAGTAKWSSREGQMCLFEGIMRGDISGYKKLIMDDVEKMQKMLAHFAAQQQNQKKK